VPGNHHKPTPHKRGTSSPPSLKSLATNNPPQRVTYSNSNSLGDIMGGNCHNQSTIGQHCGTVVSTAASQLQSPGFDSRLGSLSVWSLHIFPMSAWVSSRCSGFLPHSKDVRVGLIGHAKLPIVSRAMCRLKGLAG